MHLCPCPLHDLRQSTHGLVGARNHCVLGVQVVACGAGAQQRVCRADGAGRERGRTVSQRGVARATRGGRGAGAPQRGAARAQTEQEEN